MKHNTSEEIINVLSHELPRLRTEYGVEKLGVFGSVGRGEESAESDLDLLVSFSRPISLFPFLQLEKELSTITGRQVDLVTEGGLKDVVREQVMSSVSYV